MDPERLSMTSSMRFEMLSPERTRVAAKSGDDDTIARALQGGRSAIARLISLMERGGAAADQARARVYPHTGRAHVVGVTGPPGCGKSTLVNRLAQALADRGISVGIIAVDPTSSLSGGAVLGDRIRMSDVATAERVFIRSMASRGSLGGLAPAAMDAVRVLDAAGYDFVLVETVGAGQAEVDVARLADTTIVVQMPSAGDDIQAMKAGLLEVADILVVNKRDLAGADEMARVLLNMVELGTSRSNAHHGAVSRVAGGYQSPDRVSWRTPVMLTCATAGAGIDDLLVEIDRHREHQACTGRKQERDLCRARVELEAALRNVMLSKLLSTLPHASVASTVARIASREEDPWSGADRLVRRFHGSLAGVPRGETACGSC
jgi:LAO/AO transport system kinase